MRKVSILLLFFSLHTALFAQGVWKNNKFHSKLTFSVIHLGISDVTGLFKDFDVTITTTKADFSDAVFELTANVSSINTEVEMRDNDLKSENFFDVATYPKLTFKSTSLKSTADNKYELMGNLTMHGITKPVAMNLWYRGTINNPMSKKPDAGFALTGTIKRSDFDIGAKFPSAMLSEEIQIKADGEFDHL